MNDHNYHYGKKTLNTITTMCVCDFVFGVGDNKIRIDLFSKKNKLKKGLHGHHHHWL